VAIKLENNLLFGIFGLMFSGLLISGIVSGVMMLGIRIKRIDPEHVAVGEPLFVRYQLENRNRYIPIFNVHIEELPVTGERGAGWQHFMEKSSAWIMHVGPRETVHGEQVFWPRSRGEVNFRGVRVWTTFPFGLIKKSVTLDQPQHTLVYPRLYELRRNVLRSIDTPGPVGTRITQRPGGMDDYFGLREYRSNDSVRHIAWKRSASIDQLVCVERSVPSPPRIRVVLDLTTPTDKLRIAPSDAHSARDLEERAISLAGSVIHQASMAGFEVGLTVLGMRGPMTSHFAVRRNHWHTRKLLAALASINLDGEREQTPFTLLTDTERSGLLVIRPDRVQPISDRPDVVYVTARQLEKLTASPSEPQTPAEGAVNATDNRADLANRDSHGPHRGLRGAA
jgi:uncharacterized protein (DUF58 family)